MIENRFAVTLLGNLTYFLKNFFKKEVFRFLLGNELDFDIKNAVRYLFEVSQNHVLILQFEMFRIWIFSVCWNIIPSLSVCSFIS